MKLHIYCECKFLLELAEAINDQTEAFILGTNDKFSSDIRSILDVVYKQSTLYVDKWEVSAEQIANNQWLLYLDKIRLRGGMKFVKDLDGYKIQIDKQMPFQPPVYMMGDSEGNHLDSSREMVIYCRHPRNNIRHLSFCDNYSVDPDRKKNTFKGWQKALKPIGFSRDIYIVDQYFLHSDFNSNPYYWQSLCQAMVANNRSEEINIYLLTGMEDNDAKLLARRQTAIYEYLKSLSPYKRMEFSIIPVSKKQFHDRHILFDYGVLTSGNSFTYYSASGQIKSVTTLTLVGLGSPMPTNYIRLKERVLEAVAGRRSLDPIAST